MTPERWQEVRQILDSAIALSTQQRVPYLDQACGADEELRAEVQSLLHSHDQAGSVFLNTPAADLKSTLLEPGIPSTRIGRRIGVYQIVEEIGHGGMGEVYRAVRADGQYTKEVALKLVRGGYDTAAVLERFLHERQILASLDHPNVARLYDGGTTEDGIPYLVMERIEGIPIDRYCQEHDLSISDRLRLFTEVCAAVHYAHQHLVIHRDIKPGNILVTADGIPKLLDFGIAKIVDPNAAVETTVLRPMTPEYASPEQIRGETITTASDIYSLGVVLYRLLTGHSPYPETTRTPLEFARMICEKDPGLPSCSPHPHMTSGPALVTESSTNVFGARNSAKRNRLLQGDLDNIVMKALRKEPSRRYASVEQLAEDVRRHLQGLPVMATPDSASYRVSKFMRRHKAGVAATALIVLAVAGGVATTLREARVAVQQRGRAERRFNDVRKLANSFLFEFDAAIKDLPGSTPARALVVKRALQYLDGLSDEARGDQSLQMEIASAYQRVGEVQGDPMFPNLGDSKGALESFSKAMTILETLSRSEPENQEVRLALASTHQQISDVLDFAGDTAGAVDHSGKALQIYEGVSGSRLTETKFQSEQVTQTYHYANLLKSVGRLDEAEFEYRQALKLSQRMIDVSPSAQEPKLHLATSLDGLGTVLQDKGDTAGALENRRQGLAIRQELARLDPNNAHYRRQLAFSYHNLGLSLVEAGDFASALSNFRKELSLFESLSAADPKDVQARRNRSLAHKQIGDALMRSSDTGGALAHYRSALEIDRDLAAADPGNSQAVLDLSFSESKVGSAGCKLGQMPDALLMLRRGLARQQSLVAKDPNHILLYNHLANSYTRLADCLLDRADRNDAIENYRKAVAARLILSQKSPNSRSNLGALAQCYANLGNALGRSEHQNALKQLGAAVDLLDRLIAADPKNAQYRITLANALSNSGRIYVRMAGPELDPPTRLQYWTKAKSLYQRSQGLWQELGSGGKLPPAAGRAIQEVSTEIARCDDSMARLQQSH